MKKVIWMAALFILGASLASGQTIRISSPAAGTNWCRGQSCPINWTSIGAVGATVRIRLMQGSTAVQEITLSTRNSGSFPWTIPAGTPVGDYTVRVRSGENPTLGETGVFHISNCSTPPPPPPPPASEYPMTFTSPAGGASLCAGSSYTVSWNRNSITDPMVRILLLTQSLSRVNSVNLVIPNRGTYNWTVPAAMNIGPHMLRLEPSEQDESAPRILAESPVFQISHCYSTRPSIDYTGPDIVEVCFDIATIQWQTRGDPIRSVDIDFYCRTLPGGIFRLAASAPNSGSAHVRIPRALLDAIRDHGAFAGTPRITSAADPDISSDSSIHVRFIRCRPTLEELSRDLVLNPVDELYLLAALVDDPKCGNCLDFDLGKIKAALGDPSRTLTMILFHAGRKVAVLGRIGGGKTPPDRVRESLAPDVYKIFFENLQDFVIILKTQEGREAAKIKTEVILQK